MAETRTARLALPQWSVGGDAPSRADFNEAFLNIENNAALDDQGPLANRPGAGVEGRYWFATDNGLLYRDNGTEWRTVTPVFDDAAPTASAPGDTGTAGASTVSARRDHRHAREAFGNPVGLSAGGGTSVGAAGTVARADHIHGLAAGAPGTSVTGDTPAEGSSASVARADHRHGRESFGAPGPSAVGDAAASGSSGSPARADHRHAREGFGNVVVQTSYGQGSSNGSAATVAHSDHAHGTPPQHFYPAASISRPTASTGRLVYESDTELLTVYDGSWWPVGQRSIHEEWQSGPISVPGGGAYGPGAFVRDASAQIGPTGRVSTPAADQLEIAPSGRVETWNVHYYGYFDQTINARAFLEIDWWNGSTWEPFAKANIEDGDLRASVSILGCHVGASATRTLRFYVYHYSPGPRNFYSRIRLDRMSVG